MKFVCFLKEENKHLQDMTPYYKHELHTKAGFKWVFDPNKLPNLSLTFCNINDHNRLQNTMYDSVMQCISAS